MIRAAEQVLEKEAPTIREIAGLIGLMVMRGGGGHHKRLELEKIGALAQSKGNFDAKMVLSPEAREEISWWLDNIDKSGKPVSRGDPDVVLFTDASNQGWGAHMGQRTAGGR